MKRDVAACLPSGHDLAQAYTTCVPMTIKAAGTPWGTLEMFSFLAVWSRAVRVRVVSLARALPTWLVYSSE